MSMVEETLVGQEAFTSESFGLRDADQRPTRAAESVTSLVLSIHSIHQQRIRLLGSAGCTNRHSSSHHLLRVTRGAWWSRPFCSGECLGIEGLEVDKSFLQRAGGVCTLCDSKAVDGRRKDPWIGQVHNSTFMKRKWRFMSGDVETEEVNNDAKLPLNYTAVQMWLVSTRDLGRKRESSNHPNVAQSLIPMSNP